MILNIIF